MLSDAGTDGAAGHRAQHLDVADRIEPEAPRDVRFHQVDDSRSGRFRILRRHEIEVAVAFGLRQVGNGAPIDPVGAAHDAAARRLAEDFGQAYHGNRVRGDDVGQHLARTDRRQLVDVAYEQQGSVIWYSPEQGLHQHDVHHRGLVDHQQIAAQWVVAICA